jgi:hypothetical protein
VNTANDVNCDNALFCDGSETCDATLDCQSGSAPGLDDGIGCTVDSCDEMNDVVSNVANDAGCDNGLFCDGSEVCDLLLDCQTGPSPLVDDGVGCTEASCDELGDLVVQTALDSLCDNGLFCDGSEACDATLDCQPGTPPSFDDAVGCTTDSCDETLDQMVNTPDHGVCDNGLFCDGSERCDLASDCQPGVPPLADDGIACTSDSCDEATDRIVGLPDDAICDNGVACDGLETCSDLRGCQPGGRPDALVLEDFDALDPQNDSIGVFVPGPDLTFRRITSDAGVVASAITNAAGATGVAAEGSGNRHWTLDSTTAGPLVAEADIPPDPDAGFAAAGAFAAYFATPQALGTGTLVCADVRDPAQGRATSVRIVLEDADGNSAAGPASAPLTAAFASYELTVGSDPLELLGGASSIDLGRIDTIGLEFNTTAGTAQAFSLDVDNVRLVPEPRALIQTIAALVAVGALWRRRTARVQRRRRSG